MWLGSKKILVTAGPTWAKIDQVRVLTNRFTGKTGLYLANKLSQKGHEVTLVINPDSIKKADNLKVFYFKYFGQFKNRLEELLKNNSFDAVIHSAAVSDYLPESIAYGKIPSGNKNLKVSLRPAPKLIKIIRRLAKGSLLIQFKLEAKEEGLIDKAYRSLKENGSDYVIANALEVLKRSYRAACIDKDKNIIRIKSKSGLVGQINKILG